MKKLKKTLMIMLSLLMICEIKVVAHGGNITGWKDKNSSEIIDMMENIMDTITKMVLSIIIK